MANDISKIKTPDGVVHDLKDSRVPANAKFTDTNYYHTTGSWNGLTYTATANGGAGALALTLPTGTTSTTVARGDHTHATSIATSTGTNQLTLALDGKYSLTAGGSSYIFTMPSSFLPINITGTNITEKASTWRPKTETTCQYLWGTAITRSGWNTDTGDINFYLSADSSNNTWLNMNIDGYVYSYRGFVGNLTGNVTGNLTGNASTATKASKLANTSAIGDANRPVYFTSDGVPTPISSSLGSAAYTSSDGYAPVEHTHAAGDIDSGQFALARIPTGTTSTTVALGNHTHAYLYGPTGQAVTATAGNYTLAFYPMVSSGTSGLFPASNNSNAIITLNRHTGGGYYSQLGFSSNGNIYYRCFNGVVINTTTAWQRLLTSSDTSTFLTTTSDLREAYLTWGGKNFSGTFGPLDAALDPALGANRFELMPGDKIAIDYSNNGSTYYDYGTSANQNAALFAGNGSATCKIGKNPSTKTVNDRLRVTVDCYGYLYTVLNKFIIKLSRNGSSNCWVKIEGALYNASAPQSWTTIVEKQSVDGWWGWNVINTGNVTVTASTHANYYRWLRFTFGADGVSAGTDCLTIYKICAYGGMGWSTPSTFARSGHIYSWNQNAEVFFPSTIYESGTSLANKYASISHTHTDAVATTVLDVTTGSSSSSKPIHLKADDLALVTDGWKKLGGRTSQASLTITTPTEGTCPAWIASAYAGTILFGTRDVHGYVSTAYNGATFTIGGGSTGNSTDGAPMWYMKFTGTNGATYNLANFLTAAITTDVTLATGKTIRPAAATNASSLGTSSYKWHYAHLNNLAVYSSVTLPFITDNGLLTYDTDSGEVSVTAFGANNNTYLRKDGTWQVPGGTASGHAHTLKITNASGTTITNLAPYTLYTLYAGNSTMQFRTPYDTTCLAEGTKILMADNSEKNIEDVVAGDIIMSYDPNTEKLCEAVIIDNIHTGRSDDYVNYYFDDGSFLSIFGKHCIYSADEGTARGVDYWEPGWKTIAADGKEVLYIGSENVHNAGRKRHFDLHSSNKLYFANGILNAQSLTLDYPLYKDDGLPEEFITALKADFDSSASLHTHQFDKKTGSILAPILKELKAQKKIMDDNKKRLADSDYLVAKFTEGLISAAEWLKAKAERAGWRSAVNKAEPLYAAAEERYKAFKAKYAPTNTKRERFNAAVARDNACLDALKAYYKSKNELSK